MLKNSAKGIIAHRQGCQATLHLATIINFCTFFKAERQVVLFALLQVFFGERWCFAYKGGFELFDEGVAQRRFAVPQARFFPFSNVMPSRFSSSSIM